MSLLWQATIIWFSTELADEIISGMYNIQNRQTPQDTLYFFIVLAPGHERNPATPYSEPSVITILSLEILHDFTNGLFHVHVHGGWFMAGSLQALSFPSIFSNTRQKRKLL